MSSYYPMITYYNKLYQAHFPQEIVSQSIWELYEDKENGKVEGDKTKTATAKLALNGALYGKSNDDYSCLRDAKLMMQICINGQLMLVSLAEQIADANIEIIQINTDGILVKCPRNKRDTLDNLCRAWEKLTMLKLDYDFFDIIAQRDVNNYIGKYTNGKVKRKGTFDWKYAENGEWHKNFSQLIVAKAVENYFLNGISIEDTIFNEEDRTLFFLRAKLNKNSRLVGRRFDEDNNVIEEIALENVQRYLVTNDGYYLTKIMPPLKGKVEERENSVTKGYTVFPCNNLKGVDLSTLDINYDYYIKECLKIINKVENE